MEFVVHGICITSVGLGKIHFTVPILVGVKLLFLAGLVANVLCLLVLRRPALKRGRSQVKEKKILKSSKLF